MADSGILEKIVVAPDKFKGSLSAPDAASSIARGIERAALPGVIIDRAPMADGGEGTVEALVEATSGTYRETIATGPLGEPIRVRYGLLGGGATAVVEMAAASGLVLVPHDRRDPLRATTRGTGESILAAIDAGATHIIVGIGGSATNDGGAGLAQALGYRLLDSEGRDLPSGGGPLENLARIDADGRDPRLNHVKISVACDVDNPLCGPQGASAIYGPQKGATAKTVEILDRNLGRLAKIVARDLGISILDVPGAGAAGGLGGGLIAFAGGTLDRGVELIIRVVGLADRLRDADLCITAEGAIDASTAFGKTAVGVARLARSFGCPTLALAGTIGPGAEAVLNEGISAYFSICPRPIPFELAVADAALLLENAAEQVVRAFAAGRRNMTKS